MVLAPEMQFTVESLTADRVPDKLKNAGVGVFRAQMTAKNRITFTVARKNAKKVFAILRSSCYNIVESRDRGLALLCKKLLSVSGLCLGLLLFAAAVRFAESRVLKVEVVGSGAYLEREVKEVLAENGVSFFSAVPKRTEGMSAAILSFPRVSYCSLSHRGGVLTVEVRVNDDRSTLLPEPLLSPVAGILTELVVVRGTPRASVGDSVEEGQILVEGVAVYGETVRPAVVIARAKVERPVRKEYGGTEEEARASAFLEFGEIAELTMEKTERGWLVGGKSVCEFSLNL